MCAHGHSFLTDLSPSLCVIFSEQHHCRLKLHFCPAAHSQRFCPFRFSPWWCCSMQLSTFPPCSLLLLVGFRCSPVGVLELGPAFHIIAHSSVPCELRSRESGQNLPTGPLINQGAKRRISRLSQGNKEAVIQLSGVFTVETCGPSVSALCEKHCTVKVLPRNGSFCVCRLL